MVIIISELPVTTFSGRGVLILVTDTFYGLLGTMAVQTVTTTPLRHTATELPFMFCIGRGVHNMVLYMMCVTPI